MTTESWKNAAITKKVSGYVGHVTTFSWMPNIGCCFVVELGLWLGLGLRLGFG